MLGWMQRMGWRLGAFALMALLVRAIVPVGYMVAEADTGSGRYLTLKLCDAHGSAPKLVDLDTGRIIDAPLKKTTNESKAPPCVFAGLTAMAAPAMGDIELVDFVPMQDANFIEISDQRPGRGIAAPPPPATGPPQA